MNTRQIQVLQGFFNDLEEMEVKIKKMKEAVESMLISDSRMLIPVAQYEFHPNVSKDKE